MSEDTEALKAENHQLKQEVARMTKEVHDLHLAVAEAKAVASEAIDKLNAKKTEGIDPVAIASATRDLAGVTAKLREAMAPPAAPKADETVEEQPAKAWSSTSA
ncbi:MAG TPA: hypothetical protein VNU68_15120 [Verrucomicrobiae bacterium]|nr:hypothetical protein [Verrucomicrobiae bacterium]